MQHRRFGRQSTSKHRRDLRVSVRNLPAIHHTHTALQMAKEESKYGFKDKAKAEESLELLKSEDLKYQQLTVRGLIGRAKRVLTREYS